MDNFPKDNDERDPEGGGASDQEDASPGGQPGGPGWDKNIGPMGVSGRTEGSPEPDADAEAPHSRTTTAPHPPTPAARIGTDRTSATPEPEPVSGPAPK